MIVKIVRNFMRNLSSLTYPIVPGHSMVMLAPGKHIKKCYAVIQISITTGYLWYYNNLVNKHKRSLLFVYVITLDICCSYTHPKTQCLKIELTN